MGANPTQALGIAFMLVAFVLLALTFAGGGLLAGAGAVVTAVISCYFFLKCKPWENKSEEAR